MHWFLLLLPDVIFFLWSKIKNVFVHTHRRCVILPRVCAVAVQATRKQEILRKKRLQNQVTECRKTEEWMSQASRNLLKGGSTRMTVIFVDFPVKVRVYSMHHQEGRHLKWCSTNFYRKNLLKRKAELMIHMSGRRRWNV